MSAQPERGARKPITVIHFPKVGKPVAVPRRAQTVTEVRAPVIEEIVTEPESSLLLEEQAAEKAAQARKGPRRRRTRDVPQVGGPAHKKGAAPERRRTAGEVAELVSMGHQLFELGKVQEARSIFEGLVADRPNDGYAHTMLGTIYLALADQDRALALFQAALAIDQGDLAARVYRGEIRLGRGKVRPALDDFEAVIERGPADDPFVDRAARLAKMARAAFRKIRR